MAGEASSGRYEVAIETFIDFRVYPPKGRALGQKPWIERMKEATNSTEPMNILFEGRRFRWHPGAGDVLPTVTVPIQDADNEEPERAAMLRFLSALSYAYGYGITIYSEASSGNKTELDPPLLVQPRMKPTIFPVPDEVEVTYKDEELSLSLALMREGAASTSKALQYLSYWKAIEVAIGDAAYRSWLGPAASQLEATDPRSADDWFNYLNETRIAAAHALPTGEKLQHDPDDPSMSVRLTRDVGTIFQLARRAIGERWPDPVIEKGSRY
jgi:hypothetical protein